MLPVQILFWHTTFIVWKSSGIMVPLQQDNLVPVLPYMQSNPYLQSIELVKHQPTNSSHPGNFVGKPLPGYNLHLVVNHTFYLESFCIKESGKYCTFGTLI